ncbi:MAG: type II secretion system F family protein [Deltaproteobacteria bacterium]|nr:type II secretion system F family protein [Deltaproteobacteria bacterium]
MIVMSILSAALAEYEKKYVTKGARELGDMFLFISPRQLLIFNCTLAGVLLLLGFLLMNWFFAILCGLVGFILPRYLIRYYRKRRIARFNQQFVDALTQMSAAFRAGLTMPQAMENVSQEAPSPLGQEFRLTIRELKLGLHLDEALENMSKRVGSEDLTLTVTASNISRQLGGNMAEMFEIIASTIRERFRLEGKIRALTAQGKLQGWIVGMMPLLLGAAIYAIRPDLMVPMLQSWFGYGLIAIVIVMEVCGMFFIRRIVDIDV